MKLLVLDANVSGDLIARRKKLGIDKYDEVWDGVYIMPPMPNNEHQRIVMKLCNVLYEVLDETAAIFPGANVSDRADDWEHNYRCPDVVVVLTGGQAIDRGTHWQGGPDFLVEIRSPGDDSTAKIPFYAGLGVREVLVLDRDARTPALYRLARGRLTQTRPADLGGEPYLVSTVVPLAFRKVEGKKLGPRLEVRRTAGRKKVWLV
jgi:Uma2 family endonuclease